jgi:hypothetical protein
MYLRDFHLMDTRQERMDAAMAFLLDLGPLRKIKLGGPHNARQCMDDSKLTTFNMEAISGMLLNGTSSFILAPVSSSLSSSSITSGASPYLIPWRARYVNRYAQTIIGSDEATGIIRSRMSGIITSSSIELKGSTSVRPLYVRPTSYRLYIVGEPKAGMSSIFRSWQQTSSDPLHVPNSICTRVIMHNQPIDLDILDGPPYHRLQMELPHQELRAQCVGIVLNRTHGIDQLKSDVIAWMGDFQGAKP